jgi:hypothetical protein
MAKAKITSRHQALVKTNERIAIVAGAVKGLAETLAKEDAERVKRFEGIAKILEEHGHLIASVSGSYFNLKGEVEFNAQPFWLRWWQTWKAARERTANATAPPFLDLDFEDDVLPEIERQTGPIPEEMKAECKAAGVTDAEEMVSEHDKAAAADRQHDADREATLAGGG